MVYPRIVDLVFKGDIYIYMNTLSMIVRIYPTNAVEQTDIGKIIMTHSG